MAWEAATTEADVEAVAEISALCQASSFPTLSQDQLNFLLKQAKRADGLGRSILHPQWEPTYNLNYAVAKGWELKAGNAAAQYDIADTDQKLSRSQVFAQCMAMARTYKAKLSGTVVMRAPQRSVGTLIPLAPNVPILLPTEQQQENA